MKKIVRKIISILLVILAIFSITINVYGHSGRTDSSGGHRDNKNKSGLGSYHYHCGGHPAHLHTNGICPYSSQKSYTSESSSSNTKITSTTSKTKTNTNTNTSNNTITYNSEDSNPIEGLLTLGVLGGGGYWIYKKSKNK